MDKAWYVAGMLGFLLIVTLGAFMSYAYQSRQRLEDLNRMCYDTNLQVYALRMKYRDLNYVYTETLKDLEACEKERNLLDEFLWKLRDLYTAHVHLMYAATLSDYGDLNCETYIELHGIYSAIINDFLDFMRAHKDELIASGQFTEDSYYEVLSDVETLRSVADTLYSECLGG